MRKEYHKLVRDHIPTIIRRNGYTFETEVMTEEDYRLALRRKLLEEAREALEATTPDELATELADLYEVINALMNSYGITADTVHTEQERRRIERGGFEQRIRLLWME